MFSLISASKLEIRASNAAIFPAMSGRNGHPQFGHNDQVKTAIERCATLWDRCIVQYETSYIFWCPFNILACIQRALRTTSAWGHLTIGCLCEQYLGKIKHKQSLLIYFQYLHMFGLGQLSGLIRFVGLFPLSAASVEIRAYVSAPV